MLRLDTTVLRKFENENKNQNKKNLRLKIYGKIRNGRLKLEPSVLIKKSLRLLINQACEQGCDFKHCSIVLILCSVEMDHVVCKNYNIHD